MARSHSIYIVRSFPSPHSPITLGAFTVKHEAVDHIQWCLSTQPEAVIRIDQWLDAGGFKCSKTAAEFTAKKPTGISTP